MGHWYVTLQRHEIASMCDDMWSGIAAADEEVAPPDGWPMSMRHWIYLLTGRLHDQEANPGYEPGGRRDGRGQAHDDG